MPGSGTRKLELQSARQEEQVHIRGSNDSLAFIVGLWIDDVSLAGEVGAVETDAYRVAHADIELGACQQPGRRPEPSASLVGEHVTDEDADIFLSIDELVRRSDALRLGSGDKRRRG